MPKPKKIDKTKQLLAEGKDLESFLYPFLERMDISGIQIQDFGSISELAAFLKQFVLSPGFRQVVSVGIIRDSEQGLPQYAFQSVCDAINKAKLTPPQKIAVHPVGEKPNVGVYILPDKDSTGMLESLILRAVACDPIFECVESYLKCVSRIADTEPKPKDKAKFLAFLASRPDIKPLTGYAARAGYLNFESPEYDSLKKFISSL